MFPSAGDVHGLSRPTCTFNLHPVFAGRFRCRGLFSRTFSSPGLPDSPGQSGRPIFPIPAGQFIKAKPYGDQGRTAPEIAGELLLARSQDGRSLVQFSKTPFPILTGQTTPTGWQIEFPPQRRSYLGRGQPPARLIWLHLAGCLFGNVPPPRGWTRSAALPM